MKTGYEVAQIKRRVRADERNKVIDQMLEIIDEKIKALDGRIPTVKFAYQSLRKDVEKLRGEEQ